VQSSGSVANKQLANNFVFEPLLNDEQAADLLGKMHVKTLQRMARKGHIPTHKIGRFWYFRASELDRWLRGELTSPCQSVRVNEEN
jgi:excisionase family DNA binding protein